MTADYEKMVQEYKQKNKKAFVLGYTGAVGSELVKTLLSSQIFAKIVLIGRRIVTYDDELYNTVEQRLVDFSNLDAYADEFENFDVGYCCLGTTYVEAGPAGYLTVDHDYVLNAAQLAKKGGCSQFHVVTSIFADKNSFLDYYRIKGETEEELKAMDFESLFVYRPAMVLVERERVYPMEALFKVLLKPITWFYPSVVTITTASVARSMLSKTLIPATEKFEILENDEMQLALAASK